MAEILKGLFGGAQPAASSAAADPDFADFAGAPSPAAPAHSASAASDWATSTPMVKAGRFFQPAFSMDGRPYTKWYRVWERVTINDFFQELILLPILLVVIALHFWGSQANKSRAKQWAATHMPILESEFASVGYSGKKPETLKQKTKNEYTMYATGRLNVAWVNIKLMLYKRDNPVMWFGEAVLSFFIDSVQAPVEKVEATILCFDGQEKQILVQAPSGNKDSSFNGFVWAIVHKDKMKELRDDRYDLSLTSTRDHPKLPDWATVMSENSEISDTLITPELIKAINEVGEDLESLIITDQPIDAPKKLNDLVPRKRVSLSMKLIPKPTSTALFQYFLRIPDQLVSIGHFRPEVMRKIKATREEEMRKIRKVDEDEKAEERRNASDKMKKEERERKLNSMSSEEQKKFLEREREQDRKKGMKKQTMRG